MNKQLDEYSFLTETFGVNFKDKMLDHNASAEDSILSRKQIYKAKKNAPDLTEFIMKGYLELKPRLTYSLDAAIKIPAIKHDLKRYREKYDDLDNQPRYRTFKGIKALKRKRRVLENKISKLEKLNKFERMKECRHSNVGPVIISRMGSLSLFLNDVYGFPYADHIKCPNKVFVYINTHFVQLFYDVTTDYLTIYSPNIITPDYARKNKIAPGDNRPRLPSDIVDFESLKLKMEGYDVRRNEHDDSVKTSRLNAFQNFKRKHPREKGYDDYSWITNYDIVDTQCFLVSDEVLAMIMMCLSYRDDKKRKALKRLFAAIIYFNTPFHENINPLRSKKIRRTGIKKIREKRKRVIAVAERADIANFPKQKTDSQYADEVKRILHKVRNRPIRVNRDVDMEFDDALRAIDSIMNSGDRKTASNFEGNILFWVFLNLGLYNLTNFLDTTELKWKKDSYKDYMARNKDKILGVNDVLESIRYYYSKQYKTRQASTPDYKVDLVDNEMQKDLFIKNNRGIGPIVFLTQHKIFGTIFAREYFKVHGKLI